MGLNPFGGSQIGGPLIGFEGVGGFGSLGGGAVETPEGRFSGSWRDFPFLSFYRTSLRPLFFSSCPGLSSFILVDL